jgi:predicted DNA-binding transcriptional regulator YafY
MGFMTKEEYEAAIESLTAMYSQLPEERFLNAKRKLSAQMKTETRDLALSGDVGAILVDGGTWGDTKVFSEKLKLFEECIKAHVVLEIEYHSRNGKKTQRKIEPHVLVFKQNVWYVYAFCRNQKAFRLFRLGRIFSSFVTEERFIKRNVNREDIPLNFWSDETSSIDVTLEVRPSAFADVHDWLGGENLRLEKDVWRIDATLPDDEVLVRKIVELGSGVKVLSPVSLQQRVVTLAKELLKQYE